MPAHQQISVAICGGGIAGLCMLYGLAKQPHINATLYEASGEIAGEEGSGIGLAPNAIRALGMIGPPLVEAVKKAGGVELKDPYARVMMGDGPRFGEHIVDIKSKSGEPGYLFERSKFTKQLFQLVDPGLCQTKKKLGSIELNADDSLTLTFEDGATTTVDAVIGADGVHSKVRHHVLRDRPAEIEPVFSKYVNYITMVPMEHAKKVIDEKKYLSPMVQYAWVGKDNFLMYDAANDGETLQIIACTPTEETFEKDQWVRDSAKEDVESHLRPFKDLGTSCAKIFLEQGSGDSIPARSLWEHPKTSTYASGHAVIMGDAAKAIQPWQAAGAGQAIESAMLLASLLAQVQDPSQLTAAFAAYSQVRLQRTHYIADMSAECGQMLTGRHAKHGLDVESLREAFPDRWDLIWYFDLEGHRKEALKVFREMKEE